MKIQKQTNNNILNYTIPGIIIGFFIILFILIGYKLSNENVYMKVDNKKITNEQYQIYYTLTMNSFLNTYNENIENMGLDLSKDFSYQYYSEEQTWEDYFKELTNSDIITYVVLNNDKNKNKVKIDPSNSVNNVINMFKLNAEYAGLEYEQYLKNLFGKTVTEKDVKDVLTYQYSALEYSDYLVEKLNNDITDKDLIKVYTAYPASFDTVTFRSIEFDYSDEESALMAESFAHNFYDNIQTEDDFVKEAIKHTNENTLFTDTGCSDGITQEFQMWLYNDVRKPGDKEIIDTGNSLCVVYFLEKKLEEKNTKKVYNIFIDTTNMSDEEKQEAKTEANAVYSLWQQSDKTEEKFKELALLYSDDPYSSYNGGLLDGLLENQLIEELDTWIFNENRNTGDVELIESDLGYHIVYYIGNGDTYWKYLAKNKLKEDTYNVYLNSLKKDVKINFNKN